MRILDFVIALMFAICCSLVVFTLVFNVYGPRGYNLDLTADNDTATLAELQTKIQEAQSTTRSTSDSIWDKTVGQVDANIESGSVTEGDLMKSSISSLTNIGSYVEVFTDLISRVFSGFGLNGQNSPIFWFLSGILVLYVGYLLISMVLRNII